MLVTSLSVAKIGRSSIVAIVELSALERIEMLAALTPIINHDEDQVLIVDVGPAAGRSETAFQAVGKAYVAPQRHAIVL